MNKRIGLAACLVCALMLLLCPGARTESAPKPLTVMIYLCGSNLESGYGSATRDLQEMMAAGIDSDALNVLVMAGGTAEWEIGFDASQLTIFEIGRHGMRAVRRESSRSMGASDTLADFLRFGTEYYPAQAYGLILWDHGGGPMEGACWDELFSMDGLTLEELTGALDAAELASRLSFIGFDACLMGSAEVATALAPYAQYMIASEETEPASGWNYAFLSGLSDAESGADAGRIIVDSYFESASSDGATRTLSCTDLTRIAEVQSALDAFFAPIASGLSEDNFSRMSYSLLGATGFGKALRAASDTSYDLIDLNDLVARYDDKDSSKQVVEAISRAVVYNRSTLAGACGLSVYHPYANKRQYLERWSEDYDALGFCPGYARYVRSFGALLTAEERTDWSGLSARDEGFGAADENQFSLQLTQEQRQTFAEALLLILAERSSEEMIHGMAGGGEPAPGKTYSPVSVSAVEMDADGLLTANYHGRTLYAVDGDGEPLIGPLAYALSEDGRICTVRALYSDRSGREDSAASQQVLLNYAVGADGALTAASVQALDSASGAFTSRIPVFETEYTNLLFYPEMREMPEYTHTLPGFDEWKRVDTLWGEGIRLPCAWGLAFFDTQLTSTQLYAAFQVTDAQQNRFLSELIPVRNPNLEDIDVQPRSQSFDEADLTLYVTRDASPLDPGINIALEITNRSQLAGSFICSDFTLNGTRALINPYNPYTPIYISDVQPGQTVRGIFHVDAVSLTGLSGADRLSFTMEFRPSATIHDQTRRTLSFELNDGSLDGIAPKAGAAIGAAEADGVTWELYDPRRTQQDELAFTAHLINDTDQDFGHSASAMVNGIQTSGDFYVIAPRHTDCWCSVTVSDRVRLENYKLRVNGAGQWYSLASDALLEMYGVREVTSVTLLTRYGYDVDRSVTIPLAEPWRISDAPASDPPASRPLLEGEVSASVERALLADNGVGLRLTLKNDGDRAQTMLIDGRTLNGKPASNEYPVTVVLPARSLTVICVAVEGVGVIEPDETIETAGLRFRVNDRTSDEALITLHPGSDGSRYLSASELETTPVPSEAPSVAVLNAIDTQDYRMEAEITLTNEGDGLAEYFVGTTDRLSLRMRVTNRTEQVQNYAFEDAVLNDALSVGEQWLIFDVAPGETAEGEILLEMDAVAGLEALNSLSAALKVYEPSNYMDAADAEVRFELSGSLEGFAPPAPPALAEADSEGVHAELCGIEQDADGAIELMLRLRNDGQQTGFYNFCAQIETVGCAGYTFFDLAPGLERYLKIPWSNAVRVPVDELDTLDNSLRVNALDHILERRGVSQIRSIRVTGDSSGGGPMCFDFGLAVPFALEAAKDAPPLDPVVLIDKPGGRISAVSVVVGRQSLAVVLEAVNPGAERVKLRLDQPRVNGLFTGFRGFWADPTDTSGIDYHTTWTMQGGSTWYVYVPIDLEYCLVPDERVEQVALRASLDGALLDIAAIALNTPAQTGVTGGVRYGPTDLSSAWDVGAALIDRSVDASRAGQARAVRLEPALDAQTAERVVSGTADVVLDDGQTMRLVGEVELERDPDGTLFAPFCGLTLAAGDGSLLWTHSFRMDDGTVELGMAYYLFTDAYAPDPAFDLSNAEPGFVAYGAVYYGLTENEPEPSFYGDLYDAAGNDLGGNNVTLGAAKWLMWPQIAAVDESENVTEWDSYVWPAWKPLELTLVPVESLNGRLRVWYSLALEDGTVQVVPGTWPE